MKWFKRRPKEQWKLVKTISATLVWTSEKKENETDNIVYYLYESSYGNRRMEYKADGYAQLYKKEETHPMYLKCVYPWVKGASVSDVPTYWDVAGKENEYYIEELYKRILKNSCI